MSAARHLRPLSCPPGLLPTPARRSSGGGRIETETLAMSDDIAEDEPFAPFARWFALAEKSEQLAEAMTVATATRDGRPSLRALLLKGFDARGFVFYTNLESRKAGELALNPHAAL